MWRIKSCFSSFHLKTLQAKSSFRNKHAEIWRCQHNSLNWISFYMLMRLHLDNKNVFQLNETFSAASHFHIGCTRWVKFINYLLNTSDCNWSHSLVFGCLRLRRLSVHTRKIQAKWTSFLLCWVSEFRDAEISMKFPFPLAKAEMSANIKQKTTLNDAETLQRREKKKLKYYRVFESVSSLNRRSLAQPLGRTAE